MLSMENKTVQIYSIGGVGVRVCAPERRDWKNLSVFAADADSWDAALCVDIAESIEPSTLPLVHTVGDKRIRSDGISRVTEFYDNDGDIMLKITSCGSDIKALLAARHADCFGNHIIMKALELPRLMLRYDAVFLHASFIIYRNKAILFTADRQVGKSTQAALWEKHMGAKIINGDRALLRKCGDKWTAFGSPYCGTSDICENASAELAAIVILSQASENRVCGAGVKEALAAMLSGATYDASDRQEAEKCMDICTDIIENVPFLKLSCTPDVSAVQALDKAIAELLNEDEE